MKKFFASIISTIFFGSLVFAQLTEFSQGDILSAGAMNQNFSHLQNQFSLNKKEIDCSSDNLTATINQGYNHIVINGNCSVKNLFIGLFDISPYCNHSQANNKIQRLMISGKTGKSSDTLTINGSANCDSQIGVFHGGSLNVSDITINLSGSIMSSNSGNIRMRNVIVAGGSSGSTIGAQRVGHIQLENFTTTSHDIGAESGSMIYLENTTSKDMYIRTNGMIEGDNVTVSDLTIDTAGVAEFNKLTIDCSSASSACITAYAGTTIKLKNSTITGNGSTHAISISGADLDLKGSTINSTNSESIKVDYSYISAATNNTIQGTIKCSQNGLGAFDSAHTTSGCN